MPQAKTESCAAVFGKLRCRSCTATFAFLQCGRHFNKSCAAANEKMHCNIEKAALQKSGAFLPLSCGFQAPTFKHPRLGPAENHICGENRLRKSNWASLSELQTHPNLHSPVWLGQTAVIPSERVQIWMRLFVYAWYCPGLRLQIWVCLICVISWPGPLCRNASGILLYKLWRILPGIFREDFSGHCFPTKMMRENPATKSAKKSGGPKLKICEKSILSKTDPKISPYFGQ